MARDYKNRTPLYVAAENGKLKLLAIVKSKQILLGC